MDIHFLENKEWKFNDLKNQVLKDLHQNFLASSLADECWQNELVDIKNQEMERGIKERSY